MADTSPDGTHNAPRWGDPVKLLPLLAFFTLAALLQSKPDMAADGWRYLANARNLMHGYFASPASLMFWNGPGYPLFIFPFVALGLPFALARVANAVCLYLAVVHCHGTLRVLGVEKRSLLYAYLIGGVLFLHGPLLGYLMSESLSVFLLCGAGWHYSRAAAGEGGKKQTILAGLHLGYLALTKVFFGYALEASLVAALAAWLPWRASAPIARAARSAAIACALGLLLCLPWLAHTWSHTGKIHFWGNSGGFQVWYLTWPEKEYHGDWLNWEAILQHEDYFRPHIDELQAVLKLDPITQDSVLKVWAKANCRAHPRRCFENWRANVNRMVFSYPITAYAGGGTELATGNRSFIYALPFFLLAAAAVPGWLGRRKLAPAAHACLLFALICLGGTSLLSAIPRQLFPMLPPVLIWCVLVAEQAVEIKGRWGRPKP